MVRRAVIALLETDRLPALAKMHAGGNRNCDVAERRDQTCSTARCSQQQQHVLPKAHFLL